MKIDLILESVCANDLKGGALRWGPGLCPLSKEEMDLICFSRDHKESLEMRKTYENFVSLYDQISTDEKESLRDWAISEFLRFSWNSKDFGIRPKWTWNNFLSKIPSGSNFLDVGPCHGIHSNLVYKEYYKGDFNFFSAELQIPYLQLQKILGVDARFFDASKMKLTDVYSEASMDAILFTEVLEHLSPAEGERLIEEICRVLKPEGSLMISFPVDAKPFDFFTGEAFGHQHQPSLDSVMSQLSSLDIEKLSYVKLWSGKAYQHVIVGQKK